MRSLLICASTLAITGPYYLGYDCPDSCCDRVPECGNLPGSIDTKTARLELIDCLKAKAKHCYVSAHLGFVAAGFDIYLYRKLLASDNSNAIAIGVSYEDIFRQYPDIKIDPIGSIVTGHVDPSCNWRNAALLYGNDTKSRESLSPVKAAEGTQRDMVVSIWPRTHRFDESTTFTGFDFDSHRMNPDYSHLLTWIDKSVTSDKDAGCAAAFGDGSGLEAYSIISGVVKNMNVEMVIPTVLRMGSDDATDTTTPFPT